MMHTTFTRCILAVCSAVVNTIFSAWANAPWNLSLHRQARRKSQFIAQHCNHCEVKLDILFLRAMRDPLNTGVIFGHTLREKITPEVRWSCESLPPRSEDEHEIYNLVLNSIFAKFGKYLKNLQDSPLNVAIWASSRATAYGLHLGLQRITKTSIGWQWREASQGRKIWHSLYNDKVKILIDRKDSYNMQILQDWKTFRWSGNTWLSNAAAKSIRMKVHVFSGSTSCVGVSHPDPSNTWATQLEEVRSEPGFNEKLNLAAWEVQSRSIFQKIRERANSRTFWWKNHIRVYVQLHCNGWKSICTMPQK